MKNLFILNLVFFSITSSYGQIYSEFVVKAFDKVRSSDYKGALDDYNTAIAFDTTDCGQLYHLRGNVKAELEDYKGAILDYTVALKSNLDCKYYNDGNSAADASTYLLPVNSYGLYLDRGKLKIKLEDYMGAIADFSQAIKLNSKLYYGYYQRGKAKEELQDYRGAIADFDNAVKIDPSIRSWDRNNNIYFERGYAKFAIKDYQGAILDFTKCILNNKDKAVSYYNRGLAKINLKQKNSGCMDLSAAGELGLEEAYEKIKEICNK